MQSKVGGGPERQGPALFFPSSYLRILTKGFNFMGTVIFLNNATKLDIPPDRILNSAVGLLEGVVLLGYDKGGEEYFASSYADGGDVLWLLEKAKKKLMEIEGEDLLR